MHKAKENLLAGAYVMGSLMIADISIGTIELSRVVINA